MLENRFKTKLIKKLESLFPGCMVFHLDPNEYQGIPDLLILYEDTWFALEGKQYGNSSKRPNQDYYVDTMNKMSFATFIDQDNEEDVLNELQRTFKP